MQKLRIAILSYRSAEFGGGQGVYIKDISYQGGINPNVLLEKDFKFNNISSQMDEMKDQPYVVNLAHGVNKETDPNAVKILVDQIKLYR